MPAVVQVLYQKEIQKFATEAGFDRSESGSERFLSVLEKAIALTCKDVKRSHKHGLCLDCYAVLGKHFNDVLRQRPNQ